MSTLNNGFDRYSTLPVACGLHVIRYVSFGGAGVPAVASIVALDESVTILDMPGRSQGVLRQPGDCLALSAQRGGDIGVGLRRGAVDGALEASLRLEPIVLTEEGSARLLSIVPDAPIAFSVLAHLANLGDVKTDAGLWLGGPDRPAVVEGLEIIGSASAVPIELQVLIAGKSPHWSDWVGPGQFVGTRGRKLPLQGLRMRLRPEALGLEIAAEGLFLGALVSAQQGRQVEFISGSGVDPLVGVKIVLRPAQAAQDREREPRVRVFRASRT